MLYADRNHRIMARVPCLLPDERQPAVHRTRVRATRRNTDLNFHSSSAVEAVAS